MFDFSRLPQSFDSKLQQTNTKKWRDMRFLSHYTLYFRMKQWYATLRSLRSLRCQGKDCPVCNLSGLRHIQNLENNSMYLKDNRRRSLAECTLVYYTLSLGWANPWKFKIYHALEKSDISGKVLVLFVASNQKCSSKYRHMEAQDIVLVMKRRPFDVQKEIKVV